MKTEDILIIPPDATRADIIDAIDRCQPGQMLQIDDRIISVVAFSSAFIDGDTCLASDRGLFPVMTALLFNGDFSTPEACARHLVACGIVAGRTAGYESKWQRLSRHYRQYGEKQITDAAEAEEILDRFY
jgi:hypothetical protein